jgi:catechol 2,3-dioxygenase-like lactoylglutathione lyase family enzyme
MLRSNFAQQKGESPMKRLILIAALALSPLLSGCLIVHETTRPAAASADAAAERGPIDLRRTTLLVRDMEASLALYEGALGLETYYDQMITSRDGGSQSHLVLLRANDPNIGVLGLWELEDAGEAPPPAFTEDWVPGEIVLLFNTSELDEVFPRAAAVDGVTVISPPTYREYPGDGVTYQVRVSMLRDPDGHIVELNNRLSPPIDWD